MDTLSIVEALEVCLLFSSYELTKWYLQNRRAKRRVGTQDEYEYPWEEQL